MRNRRSEPARVEAGRRLMRFCLSRRHEAERLEQEARGKLERQRITDQAEAERARKELLELEALRWVHQNQTHIL